MSAVPVPAEVFGGTSDLPSRVAFIFSAKAGPAKAMPSASVASMVLVFMVLSRLTSTTCGVANLCDGKHHMIAINDFFKQGLSGFIPGLGRADCIFNILSLEIPSR